MSNLDAILAGVEEQTTANRVLHPVAAIACANRLSSNAKRVHETAMMLLQGQPSSEREYVVMLTDLRKVIAAMSRDVEMLDVR